MPRKPRRRSREIPSKGILNEQVCVSSMLDYHNIGDYFVKTVTF